MSQAEAPYAEHSDASVAAPRSFPVLKGWLILFVLSLAVYAATANRGPQWQDSGNFILRIYTHQLHNPLGLALAHPLHYWLGRLAMAPGWVEPCFAITLVSALGAALAVANVYGCVRALTGSHRAALWAAVSLGVAHTFWRLATLTEVYTLSAALLAGECWCLIELVRRRQRGFLWGMLLLNGLGIANHMQASLTTPILFVVALLIWRHGGLRKRDLAIGALFWLVGTLPYTWLVVGAGLSSGDWPATISSALFGAGYRKNVFNLLPSARLLAVTVGFTLLCFPNLLLPTGGYGMVSGKRTGVPAMAVRALLAGLVLNTLFVCRYDVIDQHTFFLPTYVLLVLFGGIGFAAVQRWPRGPWRRRLGVAAVVLLVATPAMYLLAVPVARSCGVLDRVARHKPYRDDYEYLLAPWSVGERSAERMAKRAVELAGEGGMILVEDPMGVFAVQYEALRAGSAGPEVVLLTKNNRTEAFDRAADDAGRGRGAVFVPADVRRLPPAEFSLKRVEDLYVFPRLAQTQVE